jgi:E3 ubiquitin-protein ligase EDD1
MTTIQFVVHPLPGTQEQLAEKLKSVADRLNRYGQQGEAITPVTRIETWIS